MKHLSHITITMSHFIGIERTPSKPRLKDLIDALYHKVANKWKVIGILLEIPRRKLAHIAEIYCRDPHKCFVEMLETWLQQVHPPPTWAAIIEAVEFLEEQQLGKHLREEYLHGEYEYASIVGE